MAKGKEKTGEELSELDTSKFVLVEATQVKDKFSPKGAALPADMAADADAAEVANLLVKIFETGRGGIFERKADEVKFKRVSPSRRQSRHGV